MGFLTLKNKLKSADCCVQRVNHILVMNWNDLRNNFGKWNSTDCSDLMFLELNI